MILGRRVHVLRVYNLETKIEMKKAIYQSIQVCESNDPHNDIFEGPSHRYITSTLYNTKRANDFYMRNMEECGMGRVAPVKDYTYNMPLTWMVDFMRILRLSFASFDYLLMVEIGAFSER